MPRRAALTRQRLTAAGEEEAEVAGEAAAAERAAQTVPRTPG